MLIIGITWTLWAGKWTVVEYLIEKYGFHHFSVREYLLKKIKQKWLPANRDSMVKVANELREKYGPGFIVQELYHQAESLGKPAVIESIRTPWEVQMLREKWSFFLFAVDADPGLRYERITSRGSETDHIPYPVFISNEEREMQNDDPNKQNIKKCVELADYTFTNDGGMQDLYAQVDEVMKKILHPS